MSAPEKTPAVNRKLLILLGAVAALALLAVFVVMPLLTSDPLEEVGLASPPAEETPEADAEEADDAEDADESDDEEVEETFEVFTARDPFKQLVVPAVAQEAPAAGDGGGGAAPADGEAPADDQAPAGDNPPADGQGPADQDPEPTNADRAQPPSEQQVEVDIVELIDVYRDGKEDKVQVTVNGNGYDVAVNERFADHYQLLSVDGDCATFLYGDNRFVLCTGDTIRK